MRVAEHPIELRITAGGTPGAAQMAALVAAVTAATAADRPAAPVIPAAYSSPWRRAAMRELTAVPVGIKDKAAPWGGLA